MLTSARVQGVRLAYYNFEADVLLLTMTNVIPDHFAVYELGFDASSDAVPKQAVGIHHPGGVPTAISTVEAGCVHHESQDITYAPLLTEADTDKETSRMRCVQRNLLVCTSCICRQWRSAMKFSLCVQGHQYSLPSPKFPCKQCTAHRKDALPGLPASQPSY